MEAGLSSIANLMGDETRAKMLTALLAGKALTPTELAAVADVTAQTASSHLAKLFAANLVIVRKQGRHKYFQLANRQVAEVLEKLMNISSQLNVKSIFTGPGDSRLRQARVCYDHLAGESAIQLYDALVAQGLLNDLGEQTELTQKGMNYFQEKGVDVEDMLKQKRAVCKSCLDWSERRTHLAGQLGQWVMEDIFSKGWARRALDSRAVEFTKNGQQKFAHSYGLSFSQINK